jgi:proteasome lid subunit RPN8/RPN11
MDADIQFGDVEQERPRTMRRPDENRHFAVVRCGEPGTQDLPIYVDLDAMFDMETHAQSNTNVELGGVLLGGQYVDGDGRPFVIVNDCLRADHFEATKGSFKFTHDTWSDISRRLEEFPDELRMVGWYHTHPDWGVFLSSMDLFICEHFFNKPLDLALVIDPCRGDRGWFQWARTGRRDPQRTGGYYLTSSRFREEELQHWSQVWGGTADMPGATRTTSQMTGGFGAPVVNVVQDRASQWTQIAVLGSLALQTILVGLLAWAVLRGAGTGDASGEVAQRLREEQLRLDASRETLDTIARRLTDTDDFVASLEESETKRRALETSLAAVTRSNAQQEAAIEKLRQEVVAEHKRNEELATTHEATRKELLAVQNRVKALNKANSTAAAEETAGFSWTTPWLWAVAAIGIAMLVLGVVMFRSPRAGDVPATPDSNGSAARPHRDDSKDQPGDTNTR